MTKAEEVLFALNHVPAYWAETESGRLDLITADEFAALPDGTVLACINGKTYVKGVDVFDNDTRFGRLAYGFIVQ